jgi:hypothetical protein
MGNGKTTIFCVRVWCVTHSSFYFASSLCQQESLLVVLDSVLTFCVCVCVGGIVYVCAFLMQSPSVSDLFLC